MITARRVLVAIAILLAGAGAAVLLLPYDTTYRVPQIAGQLDVEVEVPCKAPLVDLLTDEPDDAWLNYTPGGGVSFTSDDRAGGEVCAESMLPRGTVGIGLLIGATMIATAAAIAGRRRPERSIDHPGTSAPASSEPDPSGEAGDDPPISRGPP
jgi:hypothetical protein